ncbi:MAG: hypothetical protein J6H31_03190 [Butyrivibrio sp.]|nr:hypothetical protein [Butyrivibrio sp.]
MSKEICAWKMNKNGSLVFSTKADVIRTHYRPRSLFEHPIIAYLVMIVCAVLDFTLFYQLLSKALYDDPATMYMTTLGLLIGFDFAPCYLGMQFRKKGQGYRVNKILMGVLATSFILAFAVNFWLRLVMKDVALPDLSTTTSLLGTVNTEKTSNPFALAFAVFAAILPAVTSLCSFGISYSTSDPLGKDIEVLEKELEMLESDLIQTRSVLNEYEADSDYYERICRDDEARYKECIAFTCEKAMYYADYVRERIKEHLKEDPSGINELSKAQYEHLITLLKDENSEWLSQTVSFMAEESDKGTKIKRNVA